MKLLQTLRLLIILMLPISLIGQNTLKMGSLGGPSGTGPVTSSQTVTLYKNGTTAFSPALTATYALSNQQFPAGTIEGISVPGATFAGNMAASSNGPMPSGQPIYTKMNYISSPLSNMFSGCLPCGPDNGMDVTTDRAVHLFTCTDALINSSSVNQYALNARVYYADLTITFNRPVSNPVVHFIGMGAEFDYTNSGKVYLQGFSTEFDLATTGLSISKLDGNAYFNVASNQIKNSATWFDYASQGATTYNVTRYAATGSVVVNGTNLTSVTFKIYMKGDGGRISDTNGNVTTGSGGKVPVWAFGSTTPNGGSGAVSGDAYLVGVSLEEPTEICGNGIDDDGDGLIDCADPDCYLSANSGDTDTDGDGIGNKCDIDDDNDGILDINEESCDQPSIANSTSGVGIYQKQLYFFNWTGSAFTNGLQTGDSQTFNLPNGLNITATFTNVVNGSTYVPTDMNTWSGATLHKLYNTSGVSESLYGADAQSTSFSVNFVATKNGKPYPLDFITLDAESTNGSGEFIQFTTNGESWRIVETYNGGGVWTGLGTKVVKATNTEFPGANTIYSSKNATKIDIATNAGGRQAVAFGFWLKCDTDNDGIVNSLDIDSDDDGIIDLIEAQGNTYILPSGIDIDKDGLDDAYDSNTSSISPVQSLGLTPINSDGTGNPNFLDIDADDDGIPDNVEGQTTAGYIPPSGTDADGDGLDDAYDSNTSSRSPTLSIGILPVNTDGTDKVDYLDLDSDNDGIPDIQENGDSDNTLSGNDTDKDGLDNNFDTNNVTWDVNDHINDPNPSTLGDADNDVAADGNNAIGLSKDVDYRDAPEICTNGIDDNGNGLVDCADPDCGGITITNKIVSSCINHPYADVATLSVTVAWISGSPNKKIGNYLPHIII